MAVAKNNGKSLQDKRYSKNEETILIKILTFSSDNVSEFARQTNLSRSTILRHYKALYEIPLDCETYLLSGFASSTKDIRSSSEAGLTVLFCRLLTFLSEHNLYVDVVLEKGDGTAFLEKLIDVLKPNIITTKEVDDGEMFDIYRRIASLIIKKWYKNREAIDESLIAKKLSSIADNAKGYLGPLFYYIQDEAVDKNK